jgi:photosystem II stability/assembly factor-like uncharacterized protein
LAATLYGGYIFTSLNGGTSWESKITDQPRNWYSISSSDDGQKLIASNYDGSVYFSTDSGENWTECNIDKK